MKKIKIFLASSIEDLRDDRIAIGDYFRQLNEIYIDRGIHLSLIKCEDYDDSIAAGGKQSRYDAEIRDSELCFFLFYRKVGEYTRHEFEVALEAFKNSEKPKIVTYFRAVEGANDAQENVIGFMRLLDEELHHYYSLYGHIDTLKLGILMQIKLLGLDSSTVSLVDGEVRLNGETMLLARNVPMLNGLDSLRELTERKRELTAAKDAARATYLADSSAESESLFFDASAALNAVSKELTRVEAEALAFVTTVTELTAGGMPITSRQREALKYYGEGNYTAAQLILEDGERENELQRAEVRAEVSKREIQGYVEEDLLWIKAEEAKGIDAESAEKVCEKYEKAVALTEKHDLDKGVLYDYAVFLKKQNRYKEAIKLAERLKWYYDSPDSSVEDEVKGRLYNLLGNVYSRTLDYERASVNLTSALEICKRLAEKKPEIFEPYLATSYGNLGFMYKGLNQFDKAEAAYLAALGINKRLAARDPETFETALSVSYNNVGVMYDDLDRFDKAEAAYLAALEIDKRLAARHPEAYEPDLARSYNNVGGVYRSIARYTEAEAALRAALEIRKRLADRNPDAYEPALAATYNNIWATCNALERYAEAEEAVLSAIRIYCKLIRATPEVFEPELARSYRNLGITYADMKESGNAEGAYLAAIEIYERISAKSEAMREIYAERLGAVRELFASLESAT